MNRPIFRPFLHGQSDYFESDLFVKKLEFKAPETTPKMLQKKAKLRTQMVNLVYMVKIGENNDFNCDSNSRMVAVTSDINDSHKNDSNATKKRPCF